jgi:hypothetical protein
MGISIPPVVGTRKGNDSRQCQRWEPTGQSFACCLLQHYCLIRATQSLEVTTSALLGNTFSNNTLWTSSSLSLQRSFNTTNLKSKSTASVNVDNTTPLVTNPVKTNVSAPSPLSTTSKSLPLNAETRRFVTRMSPSRGVISGGISVEADPSTTMLFLMTGASMRLEAGISGYPGRKDTVT